jgi:hypothetical protein
LFINNSSLLSSIDFVILDIDLDLWDDIEDLTEERSSEWAVLNPLLKDWYEYPGEELNLDDVRILEKTVREFAGYHLWTKLVIDRAFPRERVFFASNYMNFWDKINKTFGAAMIDRPNGDKKSSPSVKEWVRQQSEDPYTVLRRSVIDGCALMAKWILSPPSGQTVFRLPRVPLKGGTDIPSLNDDHAKEYLATIPFLLPPVCDDPEAKKTALTVFIRTLTQDFDKVLRTFHSDGAHLDCVEFALCAVLKSVRNWCNHDQGAFVDITEADAAFLFLLAFRFLFRFPSSQIESYEKPLIKGLGSNRSAKLTESTIGNVYRKSLTSYKEKLRAVETSPLQKEFFKMADDLQRENALLSCDLISTLYLVLFHALVVRDKKQVSFALSNFRANPSVGDADSDWLYLLTQAIWWRIERAS